MNDADHDQASIHDQAGALGHPANVLDAVGVGEPQVAIEPVMYVVAVEQVGVATEGVKLALHKIGDRRLAGARQPRQPHHAGASRTRSSTFASG